MTVIGEAFVAIRPQVTPGGFEQELNRSVVPAGTKVAKTLATAIGGAFVVTKLKAFAQAGIAELEDAAAAQAQTAAAIKSTGGAANVTAEQIESLAGQQLKLTGVDDELIQKGANLLLTFTQVRNEVGKGNDIFNQATVAALDLSRAGFGSVESASVLLGKALNDPVQGLTALQRVGVRLTEDQKALVRELVATGDTLGAQKVILEEVNRQVGGSAEAYGKTLPGQLSIARESLANTQGQLLAGMAPALQLTASATTFLTDQFAKQPVVLQQVEGGLLLVVGGLASIVTPLKAGIDLWRSFGDGARTAAAAADISGVVQNSSTAVDGLYASTGRLEGRVGRLATGMVGLGVQLGAVYVAMKLVGGEADRADLPKFTSNLLDFVEGGRVTGELADSLGDDFGKLGEAVERIAAPSALTQAQNFSSSWRRAIGDTDDDLSTARARVDDLDTALAGLAARDPQAAAAALTAITDSLDPATAERLLGLLDQYDSALTEADTAGRLAANSIGGVGTASADSVGPVGQLGEGITELGGETADAATATQVYADKLEAARVAIDELFGSTQTAIESGFAYQDAVDSAADAVAELTALQKAGKGDTDEYRRAQDDAAEALFNQSQAAVDNATAQYELAGAQLDGAAKAQIQKAELERLRDTLAPDSPLRARLQGYIDQLAVVPDRKTTTVDVLTGQALVDLDRLARRLNDLPGDLRISVGGGGGLSLSGGGMVPGSYTGPAPRYLAVGGGAGPRGTDIIPAWLTPGEYVNTADTVARLGVGFFDALNRGATPGGGGVEIRLDFAPGSIVLQGGTPAQARELGGALIDGAEQRLAARRFAIASRVAG